MVVGTFDFCKIEKYNGKEPAASKQNLNDSIAVMIVLSDHGWITVVITIQTTISKNAENI